MTIEVPDLTHLTLLQAGTVLVVTTLVDVISAYVLAVIHGNFSPGVVALWLQSHTLRRVFPIFGLAALGHGIPSLGVPEIGPLWALAIAGLGGYIVETATSVYASFRDTTPPTDSTPVVPTPPAPVV